MIFLFACAVEQGVDQNVPLSPIVEIEQSVEAPEHSEGWVAAAEDLTCQQADAHWQNCTDIPIDFEDCEGGLRDEAELILQLSCSELETALDVLPLCDSFGRNCDSDNACGESGLSAKDWNDILYATDLTELRSIEDVEERIALVDDVFTARKDVRGTFSTVYRPITSKAVRSVNDGMFEHKEWTEDLIIAFSERYLINLRAHLLNGEVSTPWERYYDLAFNCSSSPLRVASVGIVVHLVVDLPSVLAEIETSERHADDFEQFGLDLVGVTPKIISELGYHYGVDAEPFFTGFFLGDWVDGIWGENTMTTFAFQAIRQKAWLNGLLLQDWRWGVAEGDIRGFWRTADGILATMDEAGSI